MKIAIIAPSAVPFSVGGAENLWWGLQNHINKFTRHQCELIKIPTKEHTFWDLIESYFKFYHLDLSHFDMVISGKYPAWMVRHPNHHIYMLHCLRGLYDTYRFMNLPTDFPLDHPKVANIDNVIEKNMASIDDFFELLFDLKNDPSVPRDILTFPGPFIRKIIHSLDKKAMSDVKRFSAISQTVADRKEYYPEGAQVKVIHPPSSLDRFKTGSYDYFFTVGRLDEAKRVRMIIEAYLRSKTEIPLKIAGAGPLEQELKKLAKNDARIEFLGFINDGDLIDCYANAYAVIFVPYDEDYGLVTIEAMMSEKPVITFEDSGGVVEFIVNEETGYVCNPTASELENLIERASENKEKIIKMGKNGEKKVNCITWEYTISELLNQVPIFYPIKKQSKKITVVSTYPIFPPRSGGQNRIFYLYREIAKSVKVEVVSLANENEKAFRKEIAPNFWEIRTPKSQSHAKKEWDIDKEAGIPITDIAMLFLYDETEDFIEALKISSKDSEYVVCSHPYSYKVVKKYLNNKIVYESHNVEYVLKKQMLPTNRFCENLLNILFEAERDICSEANLTTVCSMEDAIILNRLYGADLKKIIEVPNGVDLGTVSFVSPQKRYENKVQLGLENIFLALFIGSWHQPNIEAVDRIFWMAERSKALKILVIGSVGLYFKQKPYPPNVGFVGIVNDEEKDFILGLVDVALNPIITGSGTNLKVLDYMASGTPVISTKIGIRGLNIPEGLVTISEVGEFNGRIFENIDEEKVKKARYFVEENYSWKVISKKIISFYEHET